MLCLYSQLFTPKSVLNMKWILIIFIFLLNIIIIKFKIHLKYEMYINYIYIFVKYNNNEIRFKLLYNYF